MKDQTREKKCYDAPLLTVVTFKVEKGYVQSDSRSLFVRPQNDTEPSGGDDCVEDRTNGGFWGGSDEWI